MDPVSLYSNSSDQYLGIQMLKSAEQSQALVLQLFPPPPPVEVAPAAGQVTDTRGTLVNTTA